MRFIPIDTHNASTLIINTPWTINIVFNTLRPRQNGRHFPGDIFKCIFLNENAWIAIKISLKFVPKGPINKSLALVQIMAWRRWGDKLLSEPLMVSLLTHICVTRPQWIKAQFRGPELYKKNGGRACVYFKTNVTNARYDYLTALVPLHCDVTIRPSSIITWCFCRFSRLTFDYTKDYLTSKHM